jgi:anti-sigma regulatory factor (Ser/Thr protein kinase)
MPTEELQDALLLDSRLTELSRAQAWGDALARRLGLSDKTRYAILLCLEESLANVVLHGYRGQSGHPIMIRYWLRDNLLFVAVEDQAPAFAPAEETASATASGPVVLESLVAGGYGIGLLRHFARELVYERSPDGNRLTMAFTIRS